MNKKPSIPLMILRFIIAIPVMMAVLFWPAGTLRWVEGWVYLVLQLGYSISMTFYFFKRNPSLITKRMEMKIPPKLWDKIIMAPLIIAMIFLLIVPGFNVRYEWSTIPLLGELLGFVGFSLSLYLIFRVMKENSYLFKTVEVRKGQQVVSTGPYKVVRHPMYSSAIIMVFSIPLALGSVYGLLLSTICCFLFIVRTHFEDKTLQKELKGYLKYTKKTRYKLLPGVW